ncbi:MAG TPA: FAD:protein FMN transferase, partial [Planctomycetota bacterium]|nr:FAD:protein FMN transferase [Planctomycetota bacterium]
MLLMLSVAAGCGVKTHAPAAAPGTLQRFEYRQVAMGVEARLVLWAPSESVGADAARAAFAELARLDAALSDYRPDSELMTLCGKGAGAWPVSAELATVLAFASHVADVSGGAFDVTIGPLVRLWRQARLDGR